MMRLHSAYLFLLAITALCPLLSAQDQGTLKGRVTLDSDNKPLHHATVTIGRLGRSAETDEDGAYEIPSLPPGAYTVSVHLHQLSDMIQTVRIAPGEVTIADFRMTIRPVKESITVTASEREQTTFESFQVVTSLDSVDLAMNAHSSLGEVLSDRPAVAKRSFGPGSSRPVIRGFDGDRVLIMQDGMPTGALSSQSGDHGESLDPSTLERIEVVKGPATLLYGSNAIGGVVNAITGHHLVHSHPHKGVTGFVTGFGGTANGAGGGAGGFELGLENWRLWASGGGQRAGDYNTPIGEIANSKTRVSNAAGGAGWVSGGKFLDIGYRAEEGRYGVPFAGEFKPEENEDTDLDFERHSLRLSGGMQELPSFVSGFRASLNYGAWQHREIEGGQIGTTFNNKLLSYRGVLEQRRSARLSGSFGIQGAERDYKTTGAEALAPPVRQTNFAAFVLEEYDLEKVRFQFGGRVEYNKYNPEAREVRSFTGFSGAAGVFFPLWRGGAFVANYTHAYRAPALEELYNYGPHIGNLTYEIGNPGLKREKSDGVDLSLRHRGERFRAEANFFYYGIADFVYLAPTGEVEDNLVVAEYSQSDARFLGTEAELDVALHRGLWLNLGMDYVSARLRADDTPLPRIPPLRGRAGLDIRYRDLSVRPELRLAGRQDQIFPTETETPGYAVFGLSGTYTIPKDHFAHIFGASFFNAANRLYYNHLSFIKDRAPEIGRGVRFTYTVRFF